MVRRGLTGVVAETVEGDTTYIRPEGSKYLLPVKGLSASVKLLHLEKRGDAPSAETSAPSASTRASIPSARGHKSKRRTPAEAQGAEAVAPRGAPPEADAIRAHTKSGDALVSFLCKPNAKVTQTTGLESGTVGIQLAAPRRDGEANAELLELAAAIFQLRKADVSLHAGLKDRTKVVRLAGVSEEEALGRLVAYLKPS